MEKNEMGCQAPPDAPVLCVNNCGFFGTAATMNMCSKCHKDMISKQEQAKLAASSIDSIVNGGGGGGSPPTTTTDNQSAATAASLSCSVPPPSEPEEGGENPKAGPTRCSACRKRVGLTGFHCRCGNLFCSVHRYSDKHDCPFDYRATGQDAIAKANPMVKAQKLDKI